MYSVRGYVCRLHEHMHDCTRMCVFIHPQLKNNETHICVLMGIGYIGRTNSRKV